MACNSATVCALCLWSARVADNITWKVHAHKSGRKKINSFENKNRNIVIFEFMLWDLHTAATHIERTWKEKCNLSLLIARYSTRHVDLCKRPPQANIYYYTHILCKYISCFAPLLLWHIPSENFLVSCCAKIFVFIITCKYVFVGCVCANERCLNCACQKRCRTLSSACWRGSTSISFNSWENLKQALHSKSKRLKVSEHFHHRNLHFATERPAVNTSKS